VTLPRPRPSFLGQSAVAGVGYTALSRDSGVSVLELAATACRNAVADCGLDPGDVDGIVTYSLLNDSVYGQAVAAALGGVPLDFAVDLSLGGQAPCHAVTLAAMAVSTGLASTVVVFRAMNGRSGMRIGSTGYESLTSQFRYPIGYGAYPQYIAMWARRYMIETGVTYEDLGQVVTAQRKNAATNCRAINGTQLSLNDYLEQPFVVDPFRRADCTPEVDGACAVVVTTLERARDLKHPPAVLTGSAWTTPRGSGLDMSDLSEWPDWSRNCHSYLAPRLWESAQIHPSDVDFAEIYDCFSSVVPMALEGLGVCERGAAPALFATGATAINGTFPVNTHGGMLSEGYVHGMNTLTEAVLQVQGRGGDRQVARHDLALVTSGAMMDGSALILASDR